jgi:hypothetical protein
MPIARLLVAVVVALVATFALAAGVAHAQSPSARYQAAFKEGTEKFERGAWSEARAAFERAYAIEPRPILLFNIGSTYRREGDLALAREHYRRFLEAGSGDAALEEIARGVLEEIDRALAEEEARRAPPPEPEPEPAVATPAPVVVSPRPAPRRPRTSLVVAGYASATAGGALIGWALRDRNRADELEESARLGGDDRAPPGHTGAVLGAGVALAGVGVAATIGGLVLDQPASDGRPPLIARWHPWAVLAGASGALGGYYAYRFGQSRDELAAVIADSGQHEVTEARALEDRAHREGRVASIALGVAAGAAAASLAALLLETTAEDAPRVQPVVGDGQVGLSLGGRF